MFCRSTFQFIMIVPKCSAGRGRNNNTDAAPPLKHELLHKVVDYGFVPPPRPQPIINGRRSKGQKKTVRFQHINTRHARVIK